MTDKEKIKQEIERRMNNLWHLIPEGEKVINNSFTKDDANNLGKYTALENLLKFIDSLPEEPASEDLEEEINNWRHEHFHGRRDKNASGEYLERKSQLDIARHFAEWQKHRMKEVLQTEYEKGRFDMREEMMKDAIEGEVYKGYVGKQIVISSKDGNAKYVAFDRSYADVFNIGEKVKIIIVN